MTVPSSLVVIVPSPSLSNREKASLNSVGARVGVRLAGPCDSMDGSRCAAAGRARRLIDPV